MEQGAAYFSILSPKGQEHDLNERSIVIYSNIEGISFLFTGDLEEEGERRLLSRYPGLEVDILKAGHHGSRTSTTEIFVKQLEPQLVLISAGRQNRFGHPHPEVTDRLQEFEIPVLRTDLNGAIELRLNKEQLKVRSALNP